MGLVVRGNYAWSLVIFIIFIGFRRAEVRDVLRPFFFFGGGGGMVLMQATRMGFNFNGEGGWGSHYL